MFELTPEKLQDISIKCVVTYMAKQASLSEAIANESKQLELNPEQIKRVIETTNTLAYLRQLKDATDRTFEFPVAEYKQVMGSMVVPQNSNASEVSSGTDNLDQDTLGAGMTTKLAEALSIPEQEKRSMLMKETLRCREVLTKMAEVKEDLNIRLQEQAYIVSKDPLAIEKLSEVIEEEDYPKMVKLCSLTARTADNIVITDNELKDSRILYGLYKEAQSLIAEEVKLKTFVGKSEAFFFKEAGLVGVIGKGLGWAANKIGAGIGSVVGGTTKAVGSTVKTALSPGGFAEAAKRKGLKNTEAGITEFDKIKNTHGIEEATRQFSGQKPNFLVHRIGLGGALTATAGSGMVHSNNVNNLNT